MNRTLVIRSLLFAVVLMSMMMTWSATSRAQIAISVRIGPPALPVYEQPLCPDAGYVWTPGYWFWSDDDGYYWVPGTWVEAPVGLLWTPGYWGWNDGAYAWNAGYWGPHVGFYGGINYGYGYGGNGFYGGEWRGGNFYYNTAVTRVDNVHITNVYVNRTVIVNNESHVAFNGGQGGVGARPTAQQETYAREPHRAPIAAQVQHREAASHNRALFARENNGRPAVAATVKPGEFSGRGVVAAKAAGAPYHAPKMSPKEARAPAKPAGTEAARANAKPANERSRPEPTKGTAARPNNAANSRAERAPSEARIAPEARPKTSAPRAATEAKPSEAKPRPSEAKPRTAEAKPKSTEAAPRSEPRAESKPRPAAPTHTAAPAAKPRTAEAKPKSTEAAPRSEPRAESKPRAAAPARTTAPRESAPKAAPRKESAPPHHESAPKSAEHHPGV